MIVFAIDLASVSTVVDGSDRGPYGPRHMKKLLLWIGAGLVGIVIIANVFAKKSDSKPTDPKSAAAEIKSVPTAKPVEAAAPVEAAPVAESWKVVKTWKGQGIKKTEPFTISGKQWRVHWKTAKTGQYGIFIVTVQQPGSDYPLDTLANVQGTGEDTSYVYRTGELILNINSANASWEVTVEQLAS
ncbi:MAG: hypothetical protein JWO36_3661 [Myxococcales bacterium]|nr:hypothetical protein [Myxococcales bacterium]